MKSPWNKYMKWFYETTDYVSLSFFINYGNNGGESSPDYPHWSSHIKNGVRYFKIWINFEDIIFVSNFEIIFLLMTAKLSLFCGGKNKGKKNTVIVGNFLLSFSNRN